MTWADARRRLASAWSPAGAVTSFVVLATVVVIGAEPAGAQAAPADDSNAITRITTAIDDLRKLGFGALATGLTAIGLVLVPTVLWRMAKAKRSIQLVVDDLKDGTGDQTVIGRLSGLTPVFREEVAKSLKVLSDHARRTVSLARLEGVKLSRSPFAPRSAPDVTAQALAESLSALATEPGKPVVTFLGQLLLRPKGTKVTATLLCRGTSPGVLGISVGIVDLRDEGAPFWRTVWEERSRPRKRQTKREPPTAAVQPPGATPDASAANRAAEFLRVGVELEEVGLLEDALPHLEEALRSARASSPGADLDAFSEALTRLNAKMRIQAQGRASYRLGQHLESAGRSGEALNAYVEALPLAFHAEARQHWATAMAAETVEQARSLIVLASLITEHAHGRDEGAGGSPGPGLGRPRRSRSG